MNLQERVNNYLLEGYKKDSANYKTCQDIILLKIGNSSFANSTTIKGGVVMMELSKDKRRATQDLDIDFIKYSLDDKSIRAFIDKLSDKEIKIKITSPIKKLNHQDYDGKRIFVDITDNYGNVISTKLDIGVHKDFDVKQDELYFDLDTIGGSVSLLVNSKEQIFVEKLKSLLKYDITSTRYKDIFDFYYLINKTNLNKDRLLFYMEKFILSDNNIEEKTIRDIEKTLQLILNNNQFKAMLNIARNNWLELEVDEVIESILEFIKSLELVEV